MSLIPGFALNLGNILQALPIVGGLFGGGGSDTSTMSKEQMAALAQGSGYAASALGAPLGMSGMSSGYQQALYGLAGQMANQQGGMATLPGVPNNQGGGLKWSRVNGKWQKVATGTTGAVPTTMTAYTQALQEMLTGQGPWYAGQMSRGLGAINTQAALGKTQLSGTLGRRGLLSSGVMGQGLGSIESGRLGAISGLVGNIEQQRMQAQQFGMSQVTAQQQLINQARAVGVSEQQIQIAAQQNQWQALSNQIQQLSAGLYGALNPAQTQYPTGLPAYTGGTVGGTTTYANPGNPLDRSWGY